MSTEQTEPVATPEPPAAPEPPAPPVPAPPATPAPEPAEPAAPTEDELPDWARKSLAKANKEAAAYREAAKKAKEDADTAQQQFVQNIGKALGLVKDDETPTVDSLTASLQERDQNLTASQAENLALRTENAVLRHADKLGADASILLRLEDVKTALAALDPTADDYATQVEATVKTAVENNPFARKVPVATKSSDGNPPPAGDSTPDDDMSYEALKKRRDERRKNRL